MVQPESDMNCRCSSQVVASSSVEAAVSHFDVGSLAYSLF